MAADRGRKGTVLARQACFFCRTRKKKCDKSLPSCTYCARKQLKCVYETFPPPRKPGTHCHDGRVSATARDKRLFSGFVLATALRGKSLDAAFELSHLLVHVVELNLRLSYIFIYQTSQKDQVYSVVHKTIRATGQFVDDISALYFRTHHHHLPIISRTRFYNNLIALGSNPAADFSVLLLSLCLVTYAPAERRQFSPDEVPTIELQSLYLTARSLFAQIQSTCPPTVCLIQAGVLIALYEYAHGEPENAFVTIASVVRMAYAARIHLCHSDQAQVYYPPDKRSRVDYIQENEEAANTWWGLVVCERTFFCEFAVFDQPLATSFPRGDARLPSDAAMLADLDVIEPKNLPNVAVACLTSPSIGGFGRTAQAACLLDQVLKAFDCPDVNSKLLQLDRLNTMIQEFLTLVMPQCSKSSGVFCSAVNIPMRTLILLHRHILEQQPQAATANFRSIDEWYRQSQEALGTVAKMVVDIAESLVAESATGRASALIDGMPPTYPYLTGATLSLIRSSRLLEDIEWQEAAEDVLQMSLDKYSSRWYLDDDKAYRKEGEERQNSPS